MPIVAGISMTKLETGSPVTVNLLSFTIDDDGRTTKSSDETFIQPILDGSDLSSTFAAIAAAFHEETVQATLALPSYILIPDPALKSIPRAAHKVRQFRTIWVIEHLGLIKKQLDFDPSNPKRNEFYIQIWPDEASARLEYIEEEEGLRGGESLKEVCVGLPESVEDALDVLGPILDDMKEVLEASPTESGSDVKNIIIVDGDQPIVTALSAKIKATFVGGNIILSPRDSTKYAKYAAEYALAKYQEQTNRDDLLVFNTVPLRIGIAKADGFVLTALQRHTTLPHQKSCLLTTSTDNQTTATIKIVVGVGPATKDNTPIAELVLKDLKPRPRGETLIKVSFDSDDMGKTTITAEELGEEGAGAGAGAGGARTSIELESTLGNDLFWDDVEDILDEVASLGETPGAMEAENRWAGERVQGDLPQ